MWSGNVPSDATHDELWRFFNQPPSGADENTTTGVMSIFLISRSSCAFVNFESEEYLQAAINRFNGVPLRPHDPRCPRLVCRVRKKDDDLKAGVGGQRGVGMHTKWVKDQKGKAKPVESSDQSDLDDSSSAITTPSISVSSDDGRVNRGAGSGSSYASTNSSLLTRYFPKRYFILKSLSQFDLDLSVQKGLWATQKHNEGILDQAFRTSKEVYLIFGVNKSGEFYGYARMVGSVRQGEQRVSWASRTDSSVSSRSSRGGSLSPVTGRHITDPIPEEPVASPSRVLGSIGLGLGSPPARTYFPAIEHRLVEESPRPVSNLGEASPGQSLLSGSGPIPPPAEGDSVSSKVLSALNDANAKVQSAPAELGEQHRQITLKTPATKFSLDQHRSSSSALPPGFKLNSEAPLRARKHSDESDNGEKSGHLKSVAEEEEQENEPEREEGGGGRAGRARGVEDTGQGERKDESWGEPFKVEWVCTERLPFYRTRHIRNPWNHDKEIKVSRDGTELEPSVGQQLIDEWTKLAAEAKQQQQSGTMAASDKPAQSQGQTQAASAVSGGGPASPRPSINLSSRRPAPPPPRPNSNYQPSSTHSIAKGSRDR
ncbi:hypothetical protein K435DRAFT_702873 [Dendrothele bispora CBS 962.96]|uniref:YTH domain-containing protein n=1 Tax=Dendrothele bispora (strain CBS 962.96) TaxID=1314807 RepID=A0A4S8KNR9_DENBC|nr:hypothetical protein K435DRAFT_702873 [Dendrothele bispora CBS 962.96]